MRQAPSCEACSATAVRDASSSMGGSEFMRVFDVSPPLPSPEQPLDVGELELHIGRAAVVALAGAGC